MSSFIKLLNFEINRFFKLYMALLAFMFVIQIGGTIINVLSHRRLLNHAIGEGIPEEAIIDSYGLFSLIEHMHSLSFIGPIFISFIAILFYTFFIWYRDWIGKNTFVYRLFTLPTSRMNVYYAKLVTIFLTGLGISVFQIFIIFIQNQIAHLFIPDVYMADMSLIFLVHQLNLFIGIFPVSLLEFIGYQLLGLVLATVIFTAILFERSYRFIGNVYGVIYSFMMIGLLLSPVISQFVFGYEYFYPSELVGLLVVSSSLILIISLLLSRYLIEKKVSV